MDDNIKIEKHDHRTWITISKLKKTLYSNTRGSQRTQKKNMTIQLHITITYVYSTFSQVHILHIVVRCAPQNLFGILLNTKG